MTALAHYAGRTAVVTGGTNGIGAATARLLRRQGAQVVILGRSAEKAQQLVAESSALPLPGSMQALVSDFSSMRAVRTAVDDLAAILPSIDVLVHGVGVFLTKPEHTAEGIEKDLAVSYLSRYVFLEHAQHHGLLGPQTRLVNIAASAPKLPKRARTDFDDPDAVAARTGFASHSQAQTANDLLTAQAGARYGIAALGYGPGNTDTAILRELPWTTRALFFPFTRNKRTPDQVAQHLLQLLEDKHWSAAAAGFAGKRGRFKPDAFITDADRQQQLLTASRALAEQALSHDAGSTQ